MQTNSTAASASPAGAAASPASSARGPLASTNRISFSSMCTMFERISEAKSTKSKQLSYLELLWKNMRGATAKDYFQVLRLIMPQLDTKRSVYGLKESKIARYYVELLGLSDSSPDAIRFKHWKDPSRSAVDTTAFSDAVYVMLVKRGFSSTTTGGLAVSQQIPTANSAVANGGALPQTASAEAANSSHFGGGGAPARTFTGMSVTDVNNALDALAAAVSPTDKKAILFELLRSMCALEHKWLIRIIMKEMRIHLSQNPILGAFHPTALELFNSTNDLEHVCEQCLDPKALEAMAKAAASGSRVFLMRPFKPMLASVVASDKLAILLEGEKLLVEPKYDGERILLHFDASDGSASNQMNASPSRGPTPKILYWSRNAKNSTHLYGPKFDPIVKGAINWAFADEWRRRETGQGAGSGGLGGRDEERRSASSPGPSFWSGMIPVYNCVLDGELLLFDKVTRQFVDFGHNRTFARSGRGGGGEGDDAGDDEVNANKHQTSSSSSSPSLFGGMVLKTNDGYFDGEGGTSSTRKDRGAERSHHNKGSFLPFNPQQILENSNGRYCFQYQVFDVVFLNGECLCSTALDKRKDILRRIIREKADEVLLVPFAYVRSGQEIFNALDRALEQRHEGILIKVAGSHYVPAERKLKWMKIKPDHISGMADTMDLVILGAYYGTKYGSRHLSHFLLGCYVDDGEDSPTTAVVNAANERPLHSSAAVGVGNGHGREMIGVKRERDPNDNDSAANNSNSITTRTNTCKPPMLPFSDRRARFHTVCKVGTGYDADELRELNAVLDGKWISLPPGSNAPPWLDGWRPASGEVPDVYIHPKDSVVMEIFGFSMTETVKFRFGYTVRFPRCHRIRHDKDVEDATTTSELRAIVAASFSNGNHAAVRARLMGGGGGGVFSGADLIPASSTGSSGHLGGGGGTSLLASRRAGDLDALITMKEAKKRRKEKARLDGGSDDASLRAKKNMKGEGDFGSADDCSGVSSRKNLVFASRTILAPRAGTVEVRTGLFSGYEICVLQSSIEVMERAALECLLASHGAQIVSNPQPTTSVILASSRGHVRVQNWISGCTASPSSTTASMTYVTTDVVSVSWALACVAAGELLPLVPSNTIYASPTLRAKFRQMLDPYHDEYYRDVRSVGELRETLGRVVKSRAHRGPKGIMEEMTSQQTTSTFSCVARDGVGAVNSDEPYCVSSASSNDAAASLFPSFLSSLLSKAQRVEAIKRTIYAEFPSVVGGTCEANDAQPVVIELPSDEPDGTLQQVALKKLTASTPCDATVTMPQASPPSCLPEPEGACKTLSFATPRLAKSVALFSPPLVVMKPRVVSGTAREAFERQNYLPCQSVGEVYGDSTTTPSQPPTMAPPSVSALSYLVGRHSHRGAACRSAAATCKDQQCEQQAPPAAVVSVSVDTHSLAMLVAAVREGLTSVR